MQFPWRGWIDCCAVVHSDVVADVGDVPLDCCHCYQDWDDGIRFGLATETVDQCGVH